MIIRLLFIFRKAESKTITRPIQQSNLRTPMADLYEGVAKRKGLGD